jgi:hypothetical protein
MTWTHTWAQEIGRDELYCPHGCFVFTTPNRNIAWNISEEVIEVGPLDEPTATQLMEKSQSSTGFNPAMKMSKCYSVNSVSIPWPSSELSNTSIEAVSEFQTFSTY